MNTHADKAARFLELHRQERPLLLANAWDVGSAKLLASLGFQALATTSSGYAASLGRLDYGVSREEALAHAAALVAAAGVPVSADLEDGFAADPAGVAETVRLALEIGPRGLLGRGLGPSRAASVRHRCGGRARRRGRRGGARRARAPRAHRARREPPAGQPGRARHDRAPAGLPEAGADVLYAPALDRPEDLRELLAAVDLPVNVLARQDTPPVAELAELGVRRISVGGGFAFAAYGAAAKVASELLSEGTYGFTELSAAGAKAARTAFA